MEERKVFEYNVRCATECNNALGYLNGVRDSIQRLKDGAYCGAVKTAYIFSLEEIEKQIDALEKDYEYYINRMRRDGRKKRNR